jgi:hypothetical protein
MGSIYPASLVLSGSFPRETVDSRGHRRGQRLYRSPPMGEIKGHRLWDLLSPGAPLLVTCEGLMVSVYGKRFR